MMEVLVEIKDIREHEMKNFPIEINSKNSES